MSLLATVSEEYSLIRPLVRQKQDVSINPAPRRGLGSIIWITPKHSIDL